MLLAVQDKTDIKVTTGEPAQCSAADLTPATPVGKASANMPGYVEIDLKQIPGEVYALMGSGKLVISIGKDEFNMTNMTANAGDLHWAISPVKPLLHAFPRPVLRSNGEGRQLCTETLRSRQTTPSAVIECKLGLKTTPASWSTPYLCPVRS